MNQAKYIGMDVHQATISVAVMDSAHRTVYSARREADFVMPSLIRGCRDAGQEGNQVNEVKSRILAVDCCAPPQGAL